MSCRSTAGNPNRHHLHETLATYRKFPLYHLAETCYYRSDLRADSDLVGCIWPLTQEAQEHNRFTKSDAEANMSYTGGKCNGLKSLSNVLTPTVQTI